MLNIDETNSKFEETVDIEKEFVDALERENTFDMGRAFNKLVYAHLKLISSESMDDEMRQSISEQAESLSLDQGMIDSISEKFRGMDMGELKRRHICKLQDNANEAYSTAIDAMEEIETGLAKLKKGIRIRNVVDGLILGGASGLALYKVLKR